MYNLLVTAREAAWDLPAYEYDKVERLAINERIAAARDRLEAAGERWGRPPTMSPVVIKRAQALRKDGSTVRQIAATLSVPKSTVQRALSQKVAGKRRPPTG